MRQFNCVLLFCVMKILCTTIFAKEPVCLLDAEVNETSFWGTPIEVAMHRLQLMEKENLTYATEEEKKALTFLYVKGIYFDQVKLIRLAHFQHIINPSLAMPHLVAYDSYVSAKQRLADLIVAQGDNASDALPLDVETFDNALTNLTEWKHTGFVFHRDHPCALDSDILVQRRQHSGLCYLHAPVALSHYLVAKYGNSNAKNMINIVSMIRSTFTSKELTEYIFNDSGDSSYKILLKILQPDSDVFLVNTADISEALLREYGPGLISLFDVHTDFVHPHVRSFKGLPSGKHLGYHAMLLVGVRTDPLGGKKYLVQNWWAQKQFLEFSVEYLAASVRAIYFVSTPQASIPECFRTHSHAFAENMDKPERPLQERFGRDQQLLESRTRRTPNYPLSPAT